MAKTTRNNKSPAELRNQVVRSREQLARDVTRVRQELNFPKKIRRSFEAHPATWIVVLIAAGLATATLLSRKKKVYVDPKKSRRSKDSFIQAGFALGVLRIAANLAKPYIESLVARKFGSSTSNQRPAKTSF
jgi:hypothetical protein